MPDNVDVDAALIRLRASIRDANECIAVLTRSGVSTSLRLSVNAPNRIIGMELNFSAQAVGGEAPR